MKVKVLINCVGVGYKLQANEVAEVEENLAKKLIKFGYIEEIKEEEPPKKKKKGGE